MMTSWRLWHNLLIERARYPLFIRLAPRALSPNSDEPSLWHFLSVYTIIGYIAFFISARIIFSSEIIAIIVLILTFPAMIMSFMAVVLSPLVISGGLFVGLRFGIEIGVNLQRFTRTQTADVISVTPPGKIGLIRAVSAATLRQRDTLATVGLYMATAAHLTLSIALGVLFFLGFARFVWVPSPIPIPRGYSLTLLILAIVLVILLHLDNRQYIMLGVSLGVFAGTVFAQAIDARTSTVSLFMLISLTAGGIIAASGAAASTFANQVTDFAPEARTIVLIGTLIGYALALVLREGVIIAAWRWIYRSTGIHTLAEYC